MSRNLKVRQQELCPMIGMMQDVTLMTINEWHCLVKIVKLSIQMHFAANVQHGQKDVDICLMGEGLGHL